MLLCHVFYVYICCRVIRMIFVYNDKGSTANLDCKSSASDKMFKASSTPSLHPISIPPVYTKALCLLWPIGHILWYIVQDIPLSICPYYHISWFPIPPTTLPYPYHFPNTPPFLPSSALQSSPLLLQLAVCQSEKLSHKALVWTIHLPIVQCTALTCSTGQCLQPPVPHVSHTGRTQGPVTQVAETV